ncbi:MAG TPA: transglycosylase SLT domain-containing protein, partial [Bdellovibrionales bacterium]|nr:transglycosylase SLT domain-containing protein [Bdellovibrionales bacterium]
MKRKLTALAVAASMTQSAFGASVSVVQLSIDQSVEAPRWMYDSTAKVKGGPLIVAMVAAKQAMLKNDRAKCLGSLTTASKLGASLGPWITLNQLACAMMGDTKGRVSASALSQALARLEGQPRWLTFGPAVPQLRQSYTAGLIALAEAQSKTDRKGAWRTLDKLQQVKSWLSSDDRANTYRWAGELAFVEQNLTAAQDFLQRSLSEKESAEVRTRVESIRSTLLGKKKPAPAAPQTAPSTDDLGISDEEKEIFARMNRAFESQDYVSAIEDGVELIQKFPGSRRANESADRVLDIYLTVSGRTEEKFRHVRETMVKEMRKVDGGRMARWANNAYARGNYLDALALSETSYAKLAGHPDGTKVLLLAGKSALAAGEYVDAQTHLEDLLKRHGGTDEAAEGTFRLGLLEFRRKRYPQAAAYFERLLALSAGKDYEYRALYWQWRAQQKIDKTKASAYAAPLIEKYPLSYYGLRARAEQSANVLQFGSKPVPVKVELRLLESERLAWERLGILLKAGWFKEAERELESLPEPQSDEERILRAKYWAAAFRYDLAMQNLNDVLEKNPEYLQTTLLKIIFPDEYSPAIARESKAVGLNDGWIRALIRQESSFRPDVKSPANAQGVMQLLPSTAAELAKDLRVKDYQSEMLVNPEVNIKLGANYLNRMIRNFNGNVPAALAAYNAGPGRMKRWLGARKNVGPAESPASSAPEVELWIDELPW